MQKANFFIDSKSKFSAVIISGFLFLVAAFVSLLGGNMLTASAASETDYTNQITNVSYNLSNGVLYVSLDVKCTALTYNTDYTIGVMVSGKFNESNGNSANYTVLHYFTEETFKSGISRSFSFVFDGYNRKNVVSEDKYEDEYRFPSYIGSDIPTSDYTVVWQSTPSTTSTVADFISGENYQVHLYMKSENYSYGKIFRLDNASFTFGTLPAPEKTGYDFIGWYYDAAFTQPYQGEAITGDTSLYAKFTPIQYSITYNLNGGSLTGQWTTYNIESATYTLPTPTRNAYDFGGWFTTSTFVEGSQVTQIATGSTGAKTFYAKFTPTTYTIEYELNGGSLTEQATSYNVESATINLPSPSKTGYTFDGWFTSSNFSGSAVTSISTGSSGNKKFYAKFTAIQYNITYNLNGGSLTGQKTQYTIEDGSYTLPTPTHTGYNFKGWYTDSSLTGGAVTSIAASSTGNKVYYAKWELITFTVTFYVDGEVYKEITIGYGSVLSGYYFADSQMAAVSLFANAELSAAYDLSAEICSNIVVYASADFELFVSLTYSVNGIEMTTDLLSYNAPLSNLRTYEYEGYIFGGWYYDAEFTKPVSDTDKLTSNITIYAKLTEPEIPTFWEKVGAWFGSTSGIIVICIVALALVLGGIGYAVKKKK